MNKKNVVILFISLLIIFFVIFFLCYNKKVYFYLNGNDYQELNINTKYKEEGYTALYCNKYFKIFCKDISNNVSVTNNNKDNKEYIYYSLNYLNNSKILVREIIYKDMESPTIELINSNIVLCPKQEYIEEGYKAFDDVDGDITDKVKINIKDNKVYYNVSDSSGNTKVVYKDIIYKDNEIPKIELIGSNTIYLFKGRNFIDKGVNATDNCDGIISDRVIVENNVDINKKGEYTITYYISDSSGNKNTISRNVIVYNDYSQIPKNGKVIYLTFDDGPGSYTSDILDILDKYNIKATFFVTNQFSSYQNLIKKEYESGHTVAVHTYSHNYKNIYKSAEDYITDFNNMNQVIFEQTGEYSNIFRFPGGSSNTISKFNRGIMSELSSKMEELGYYYFDWNVDSLDTSLKNPNDIANAVISELDKNEYSVVLMHDIKKANIDSLDIIISYGLENGYTFLPLDESSPVVHHKVNN